MIQANTSIEGFASSMTSADTNTRESYASKLSTGIKKCPNRHPRPCRYKDACRRRTTCLYKHDDNLKPSKQNSEKNALELELCTVKAKLEEAIKKASELTEHKL